MHFLCTLYSVLSYQVLAIRSELFSLLEEPLQIVRPLREVTVAENQPSVLICELNKPDVTVQWTKAGEALRPDSNVKLSSVGVLHTLTIERTTPQDEAEYTLSVNELTTKTEILVDGEFTQFLYNT